MEPWRCPSDGCGYRGSPSIHLLDVMGHRPPEHMSPEEMSMRLVAERKALREQWEREKTSLQCELSTTLFEGMGSLQMRDEVFQHLNHLVTCHSERLIVMRHDGHILTSSPTALKVRYQTVMLTIRWPSHVITDAASFYALIRRYDAIQFAEEVTLSFPDARGEVVLKSRYR